MSDNDNETTQRTDTPSYDNPTGGWGSLQGIVRILKQQRPEPGVLETLARMNKNGGHMCTSCAWTKPPNPGLAEFCENGAKATVWDLTSDRCTPEFFEKHSVKELLTWSDHELERTGRLTHPLRYDPVSDHYEACSWQQAFDEIGASLAQTDPDAVAMYASGRASLETSYLWALFARLHGHNNLADSSNMCHETTSVGLAEVIGSSVGTCVLTDFDTCDLLLFFGQNTGTNSPRLLNTLQAAAERGCRIVTFNPVRERGLIEFASPQSPVQMLTPASTDISDMYLQVKPGGDIAVLCGICKYVLACHDAAGTVLDQKFIDQHTTGFDDFSSAVREASWQDITTISGLKQVDLETVAQMYVDADRTIGVYGMGLTQQVHGFQNIAMLVNLLLLKGNMGREGAGISPVRGHSNVQGQRTVGITEKPELAPLDILAEQFDFEPPRTLGRTTIEVMEGVMDGSVKAFLSLGGNFARAVPDQSRTDPAWEKLSLNVQIATKLNRSHLLTCGSSWLLPCLVRAEQDKQSSGAQTVTMEDSLSQVHSSIGKRDPASGQLKSELAIVAGIAQATLPTNDRVKWKEWTDDYVKVRDLIATSYPDDFHDFNNRLDIPGGFYRGNPVRRRQWQTASGLAHFTRPTVLSALAGPLQQNQFTLITLRSNDQFNTTIYGFSDRLRGLEGDRNIVLMNPEDMKKYNLVDQQSVSLKCAVDPDIERRVSGLRVQPYDIPSGCVGAYYPETNALVPLNQFDLKSRTPAYKGTAVYVLD